MNTQPEALQPGGTMPISEWHLSKDGLPPVGSEVIGGYFYKDTWLKGDPEVFAWGQCRVIEDNHRDFPDGKRWLTFGPSHNQITHWCWPPKKPWDTSSQPVQRQEPDLSWLKPETQKKIREWLADGSFVERAIRVLDAQEKALMRYEALEKQVSMAGGWQSPAEAKAITSLREALAEQPAQQQNLQDLWHKAWPEAGALVRASADDLTRFAQAVSSAPQPAQPSKPLTEEQRTTLREAFAHALTSVYVCGRTWEAWQYGTMSEGDFQPASECEEVLDSLIEAAKGIEE